MTHCDAATLATIKRLAPKDWTRIQRNLLGNLYGADVKYMEALIPRLVEMKLRPAPGSGTQFSEGVGQPVFDHCINVHYINVHYTPRARIAVITQPYQDRAGLLKHATDWVRTSRRFSFALLPGQSPYMASLTHIGPNEIHRYAGGIAWLAHKGPPPLPPSAEHVTP